MASNGTESIAPINPPDQWQPLFGTVFVKGQAVYADLAAPTGAGTGAQQLYQLLNALGVLRAWIPGQDDVGHGGLSN